MFFVLLVQPIIIEQIFFKNKLFLKNKTILNEFILFMNRLFYTSHLKLKKFLFIINRKYNSCINSYYLLFNYLVILFFIFKKKNSYIQTKYNDKILLQKSVGMYGYKKKEKRRKYSRRKMIRNFVKKFSSIIFTHKSSLHIHLKGFKNYYKQTIRPFLIHFKRRLSFKSSRFKNLHKWLTRKNKIIKMCRKKKYVFKQSLWQRRTEMNNYSELYKGKIYSFNFLRCFLLTNNSFGGVRNFKKKDSKYKYYF